MRTTRMQRERLDSLASAVARAAPDFDEEQQRIALAVYRRLAQGSPAPPADVAERAGVGSDRVRELVASWPGVYVDANGDVIGFWGLTIRRLSPTHRLDVNGRELYAWCAWDTLFLPGILGAIGDVESICATTNETISLRISPTGVVATSHPGTVVSFLTPERHFDANVIQSFCHFVHFFTSHEAGRSWTERHEGTFLLSLDDAFELGRLVNALNFPSVLEGDR